MLAAAAALAPVAVVVVVGVDGEFGAMGASSGSALPEPSFLSAPPGEPEVVTVPPKRRSSPDAAESETGIVIVAVARYQPRVPLMPREETQTKQQQKRAHTHRSGRAGTRG